MEWTLKENRIAVLALHRCGHSPSTIFRLLKNLKITRRFVYRTINRYNEVSSVEDKKRTGRPRSARTPAVIKAIKARIRRNPVRKQKLMALQMGVSRKIVKKVLNEDLKLRAYKKKSGHLLNARLKEIRLKRSRVTLKRYAKNRHRDILFTDEKIFDIEEKYNKRNDRVYAGSSEEAGKKVPRVQHGHHPSSVMVWLGISYYGPTEVHFCEKGVRTSAKVYQETVLDQHVKDLPNTLFSGHQFVFHPDLNPLDYKIWQVLERKVCAKPHKNLESLKSAIIKAVAEIDMNMVRAAIDDWPRRLRACIQNKGGHFE
ncbi:unnamed protein product [Colias eurytheme]|nr:unnamed protein product [Colias eurytheme]